MTAAAATRSAPRGAMIWALAALLLALALAGNYSAAFGRFTGEDEVLQMATAKLLIQEAARAEWPESAQRWVYQLSLSRHPPLRYLLSLPGLLLFPDSPLGLRLGAIFFSLVFTWQLVRLGRELGGWRVGWASGFLAAASGVYVWTSLAFAWSVIVAAVVGALRVVRTAELDLTSPSAVRRARLAGWLLAAAFLVNTGAVLFAAGLGAVYGWANRRRPAMLLAAFWPHLVFFAAYYGWFLGAFPLLAHHLLGEPYPSGQLAQNLVRSAASGPNLGSLAENLQGLNAYLFPVLGWGLAGLAAWELAGRERRAAWILGPFALAWSFYLSGNSQQYFLLAALAALPFGVRALDRLLPPRALAWAAGALAALFLGWSVLLFQIPYRPADYPERLLESTWSLAQRRHNVMEPYRAVCRDLRSLLGPGQAFVHDLEGAFSTYYCTDRAPGREHSRRAGMLGSGRFALARDARRGCWRPRGGWPREVGAVVTKRELCPSAWRAHREYPGSEIRLYLPAAPRPAP